MNMNARHLAVAICSCISLTSPSSAHAAVVLTGDAFIDPATTFGARAAAGDNFGGSIEVGSGSTVTLTAGTSLNDSESPPSLGIGDNAFGSLVIEGSGSAISLVGDDTGAFALFGNNGNRGEVVLRDGAVLSLDDSNLTSGGNDVYIDVGRLGGTGDLLVDNGMVSVTSEALAGIGIGTAGSGNGTMTMSNGAVVSIVSTGLIDNGAFAEMKVGRGDGNGNSGVLNLADSTLEIRAPDGGARLIFGEFGSTGIGTISGAAASVLIEGGDDLAEMRIGDGFNGIGNVTVTNGASVILDGTNTTRIAVGAENRALGQLVISDGGFVSITGPDAIMDIGNPETSLGDNSTGIVVVTGAGSRLHTETDILVGAWRGDGNTTGILTVSSDGEVKTPFLNIASGGILTGSGGRVEADLLMSTGGLIAPGASPGQLLIDGDLELAGGTLQIEIAGNTPSLFDQLVVTGNVFASASYSLEFVFLDDFVPADGDMFDFLSASSIAASIFDLAEVFTTGLPQNRQLSLFNDGTGLTVTSALVAPVPVPIPVVALATSLILLGGVRRRRA